MPARATRVLAIGASAGGIGALKTLLPSLRGVKHAAIIVVLHIHPQNPVPLETVFAPEAPMPMAEADEKSPVSRGVLYFAPANYHLLVERDRTFSLNADEPVNWARPSVDVLFESVAQVYGQKACGLLLTGANNDGAKGCEALCRSGATVIVQDPDDAEIPSMPRAAIACCGNAAMVMPLRGIADWLATQVSQGEF